MKIALLGDTHIPKREKNIPKNLKEKLKQEQPQLILCTGDLTNKNTLKTLKNIAKVETVQGNMDKENYPEKIEKNIHGNKIILIHGSQVFPRGNKDQLTYLAEENDAEILVSGHTHCINAEKNRKVLLLNPGTLTGAWSGGRSNTEPSFMILKIKDKKAKLKKIYKDREEEENYELH